MPPTRGFRFRATTMREETRARLGVTVHPAPVMIAENYKSLGRNLRSAKVPLERSVDRVMRPSIDKNFEVGGRPPWASLSDYTVALKGHDQPLIRTGALRRTATSKRIWTIDGRRGVAYVQGLPERAWYGNIHQAGYSGIMTIPARPFMLFQREDVVAIHAIFQEWAAERAAGIVSRR